MNGETLHKNLHEMITSTGLENKTPADQQDIFRPNCPNNDIFLRLKSSHYTMKKLRGLMEKGMTLFE